MTMPPECWPRWRGRSCAMRESWQNLLTRGWVMSNPASWNWRMREMVDAIHAIWDCWNEGRPLSFEGEFYRHTLMPPFFNPGPSPFGPPRVFRAGVGPRMIEVAGELADGFLCHGFTTASYLSASVLPALERGLARRNRTRSDI